MKGFCSAGYLRRAAAGFIQIAAAGPACCRKESSAAATTPDFIEPLSQPLSTNCVQLNTNKGKNDDDKEQYSHLSRKYKKHLLSNNLASKIYGDKNIFFITGAALKSFYPSLVNVSNCKKRNFKV